MGCDLNDPDRDVARLFPESTGYKTVYVSIAKKGGKSLLSKIEKNWGISFAGFTRLLMYLTRYMKSLPVKRKSATFTVSTRKASSGVFRFFWALTLKGASRLSISRK